MFFELLLFSICAASVSFTLSEAAIFKPFREFVCRKSLFLGKLFNCYYCVSHYIAFFLVLTGDFHLFPTKHPLFDFFFSSIVISWLGSIIALIMILGMKRAGK